MALKPFNRQVKTANAPLPDRSGANAEIRALNAETEFFDDFTDKMFDRMDKEAKKRGKAQGKASVSMDADGKIVRGEQPFGGTIFTEEFEAAQTQAAGHATVESFRAGLNEIATNVRHKQNRSVLYAKDATDLKQQFMSNVDEDIKAAFDLESELMMREQATSLNTISLKEDHERAMGEIQIGLSNGQNALINSLASNESTSLDKNGVVIFNKLVLKQSQNQIAKLKDARRVGAITDKTFLSDVKEINKSLSKAVISKITSTYKALSPNFQKTLDNYEKNGLIDYASFHPAAAKLMNKEDLPKTTASTRKEIVAEIRDNVIHIQQANNAEKTAKKILAKDALSRAKTTLYERVINNLPITEDIIKQVYIDSGVKPESAEAKENAAFFKMSILVKQQGWNKATKAAVNKVKLELLKQNITELENQDGGISFEDGQRLIERARTISPVAVTLAMTAFNKSIAAQRKEFDKITQDNALVVLRNQALAGDINVEHIQALYDSASMSHFLGDRLSDVDKMILKPNNFKALISAANSFTGSVMKPSMYKIFMGNGGKAISQPMADMAAIDAKMPTSIRSEEDYQKVLEFAKWHSYLPNPVVNSIRLSGGLDNATNVLWMFRLMKDSGALDKPKSVLSTHIEGYEGFANVRTLATEIEIKLGDQVPNVKQLETIQKTIDGLAAIQKSKRAADEFKYATSPEALYKAANAEIAELTGSLFAQFNMFGAERFETFAGSQTSFPEKLMRLFVPSQAYLPAHMTKTIADRMVVRMRGKEDARTAFYHVTEEMLKQGMGESDFAARTSTNYFGTDIFGRSPMFRRPESLKQPILTEKQQEEFGDAGITVGNIMDKHSELAKKLMVQKAIKTSNLSETDFRERYNLPATAADQGQIFLRAEIGTGGTQTASYHVYLMPKEGGTRSPRLLFFGEDHSMEINREFAIEVLKEYAKDIGRATLPTGDRVAYRLMAYLNQFESKQTELVKERVKMDNPINIIGKLSAAGRNLADAARSSTEKDALKRTKKLEKMKTRTRRYKALRGQQ